MATRFQDIPGSDSFFELPKMIADPPSFLTERYAKYGPVFKTRWVVPLVFLIGPEANKLILVGQRTSFSYQEAYRDVALGRLFAGSLLMKDGEPHRHDRDILQPAMGRLALQGVFDAVRDRWERSLDAIRDGQVIDAYDFVRAVTFDVSANALLDLGLDEELAEYKPLFQTLVDGAMAHMAIRFPFGKLDRGLKAREKLIRMLAPKIEAARGREASGMLGLLAHHREPDGSPLGTREIAAHLLLLFWAGYDTTATTAAWTLHELGQSQAWQEKVRGEVAALGSAPTFEQLDKLEAMGWVLKEVERLRPAVLFFPRRNLEEVEVLGVRLPKDTFLFYSGYLTHRIPELFPEPEMFKPERWSSANGQKPAPSTALVGFGGGPRICLGKAFALLQLRVMLATLLSRFHFAPAEGYRMKTVALPIHRPKEARLVFYRN